MIATRRKHSLGLSSALDQLEDTLFFEVDGRRYKARRTYQWFSPELCISVAADQPQDYNPAKASYDCLTIFNNLTKDHFDPRWLEKTVDTSIQRDDVLIEDFLGTIQINGLEDIKIESSAEMQKVLKRYGTRYLELNVSLRYIPSGPYLRQNGHLWQINRVYNDTNGAFLIAVDQIDNDR